jgi:hypothetical protein
MVGRLFGPLPHGRGTDVGAVLLVELPTLLLGETVDLIVDDGTEPRLEVDAAIEQVNVAKQIIGINQRISIDVNSVFGQRGCTVKRLNQGNDVILIGFKVSVYIPRKRDEHATRNRPTGYRLIGYPRHFTSEQWQIEKHNHLG